MSGLTQSTVLWHAPLHLAAEERHIMGMPAETSITTITELLALPEDGLRHELLDGEHVVTPAPVPRHQLAVGAFVHALQDVVWDREDMEVFTSPADIVLGPRTLVQPDIFVIRRHPGNPPRSWDDVGIPLLTIEILSPSTAARDRGRKRKLYLNAGVREYWIIDVEARVVERWRSGDERPEIVDGVLEWLLAEGVGGTIDLPGIFERIAR